MFFFTCLQVCSYRTSDSLVSRAYCIHSRVYRTNFDLIKDEYQYWRRCQIQIHYTFIKDTFTLNDLKKKGGQFQIFDIGILWCYQARFPVPYSFTVHQLLYLDNR